MVQFCGEVEGGGAVQWAGRVDPIGRLAAFKIKGLDSVYSIGPVLWHEQVSLRTGAEDHQMD